MSNEHNPIARLIEIMQSRWAKATDAQPDYKMIRWVIQPVQAPLINGFCQLESSVHGRVDEILVVQMLPFKEAAVFAPALMGQWLKEWTDEKNSLRAQWPVEAWVKRAALPGVDVKVLAAMLEDFHKHMGGTSYALNGVGGDISNGVEKNTLDDAEDFHSIASQPNNGDVNVNGNKRSQSNNRTVNENSEPFTKSMKANVNGHTKLNEQSSSNNNAAGTHRNSAPYRSLVLGLIPQSISDFHEFRKWILQLLDVLPAGIKIMTVDHAASQELKPVSQQLKHKSITLDITDLDLEKAMEEIATSGNPNQPDVEYRKCLFEMGKAARNNNKGLLKNWGDRSLIVTQRGGEKSIWATAHVVYAGFLMQFKETEQINILLDKAISITQPLYKRGDATCAAVLMQAFGYKAAYCNMIREKVKALGWLEKQLAVALEQQIWLYAVSICKTIAFLAYEKGEMELFRQYTQQGYELGKRLTDEEAKLSEYMLLAKDYYDLAVEYRRKEQAAEANDRMTRLFGPDWHDQVKKHKKAYTAITPLENV